MGWLMECLLCQHLTKCVLILSSSSEELNYIFVLRNVVNEMLIENQKVN